MDRDLLVIRACTRVSRSGEKAAAVADKSDRELSRDLAVDSNIHENKDTRQKTILPVVTLLTQGSTGL